MQGGALQVLGASPPILPLSVPSLRPSRTQIAFHRKKSRAYAQFPVRISPFHHAAKTVTNLTSSCLLMGSPPCFQYHLTFLPSACGRKAPNSFHCGSQGGKPYKARGPGILEAGPHVLSGRCPGGGKRLGGISALVLLNSKWGQS